MDTTTPRPGPAVGVACESCGRPGRATLEFPDTTFILCVRCLPAELRARAVPLPAVAAQVWLELLLAGEAGRDPWSSSDRALDKVGARA